MSLLSDLKAGVDNILFSSWDIRNGTKVPSSENVALAGGGVRLDATVLYADLGQSSQLATDFQQRTAAKVIKAFLYCCTRLITEHDGAVTSFDGDRVMGIFLGDYKNTNATKTALKIKCAVSEIIEPKVNSYFDSMKESSYEISHAVGIDTSKILAVRAGQRGSNDLVWVGRAPNFAAYLSEIRESSHSSYISKDVYNVLNDEAKYVSNSKRNMWEARSCSWIGLNWTIYRSIFYWKLE